MYGSYVSIVYVHGLCNILYVDCLIFPVNLKIEKRGKSGVTRFHDYPSSVIKIIINVLG
jgi:hypothetical protein